MSEQDRAFVWPPELALDDEPGPASFLSPAQTDALIFAALDQVGDGPVRGDRISGVSRTMRSHKPGIGTRSLAAAALLACISVGSASAAVLYFGKRTSPAAVEAAPLPPHIKKQTPRQLAPAATVVDDALPAVAPVETSAPVDKDSAQPSHARAPEDLLVEGNRLRAEKRWARADEAYTRAAQQAPRSQTAYVARVASAAVRLEHLHDPRGALSRYRAALQQLPDGPLREEVQWGIAETYRALGDRASERAALLMFVREHPASPLRKQAEARLD